MSKSKSSKYRLKFFIDYDCGGCLWSDNDAAYNEYGFGCLDAEIFDLNGIVVQDALIKLPDKLKQTVLYLDKLYHTSLNWENPGGDSLWTRDQWNFFYDQTKELHRKIIEILGDNYEVLYMQP